MDIAVSNRIAYRSSMGTFLAACNRAATETVEQAIKEGADMSRAIAPVGSKRDPRSAHIKDSIHTRMISSTQGEWYCDARHALPVELGSSEHFQSGFVSFMWEEAGKWWVPGENLIDHPATAPQPYLRPAYRAVSRRMMDIAKSYYPG